jgi:phage shock protein A
MTRRRAEGEELQEKYATATAKMRVWRNRADLARLAGRKADANRCDDKIRDWASRAKQIEQQLARRLRA